VPATTTITTANLERVTTSCAWSHELTARRAVMLRGELRSYNDYVRGTGDARSKRRSSSMDDRRRRVARGVDDRRRASQIDPGGALS
jgi:hypothetical protein